MIPWMLVEIIRLIVVYIVMIMVVLRKFNVGKPTSVDSMCFFLNLLIYKNQ